MLFTRTFLLAAAGVLFLGTTLSGTASAATGDVTVFGTEFTPLSVYENPTGCYKLPLDAHVLVNRTDQPVTVYADPFCLTPGLLVQPGYGSHLVAGSGSFSAS